MALVTLTILSIISHVAVGEDVAFVNLVRHAEKDPWSGQFLSKNGEERAKYFARCMGPWNPPSEIFPVPLGALLAQLNATVKDPVDGNYGLSRRSPDTLRPLAAATGLELHMPCKMTDYDCFVNEIHKLMQPDRTTMVCWEHKLFPYLLKILGAPEEGKETWPEVCNAKTWKDPRFPEPSKKTLWNGKPFPYHNQCFDLVWQIRFVRELGGDWKAKDAKELQTGFGGSASSPCAEGLAPMSATRIIFS
jgi:hypothetical protein